MENKELTTAMNKAKIGLMSKPNSVFFTTICFSLKHKWDDTHPTAYTDGLTMGINPKFFLEELNQEERIFVLAHESMHVAYMHMDRKGSRNHNKFNIAADHVINLQLEKAGFSVPSWAYCDPQYADMSTEEVYNLLPDDPPAPRMQDIRSPENNDSSGGSGQPDEIDAQVRQQIEDILVRAVIQSKMAGDKPGTIPGEVEIFLDNLLNPKLPWNTILRRHIKALSKNDYSYRRPNRRYFPNYYLPSLYSEKLVNIAVAIDTSGSVTDEEFQQFVSETASIIKSMKPSSVTIIQFDTGIKAIDTVRDINGLRNIRFTGRGGTVIEPVLEWAKLNKPNVLLVFSDGWFRINGHNTQPAKPVIWLIHDREDFEPPFGKVIEYEMR